MDNLSATIKAYESRLQSLAQRMYGRYGRRLALEDLVQLGRIGAMRALDSYEPSLGSRDTWVLQKAEFEMQRAARTEVRQSRVQRMLAVFRQAGDDNIDSDIERMTAANAIEVKAIAFVLAEASRHSGATPEEEYVTEEAKTLISELIPHLPERQRILLDLVHRQNMNVTAAAVVLGVDTSRASRALSKAYKTLREMLDSPPAVS